MFFGSIEHLEQERHVLPRAVVKGLEYLKSMDFSKVEPGKYEIEGEQIFALVQEVSTQPWVEGRPEAHLKMLDIQFVIDGAEVIGYAPADPSNEVAEDLAKQKDVIFYATVKDEMGLVLTKGRYAVFFPQEVHRPCCRYGADCQERKVVVKIAADLL
jgi:biofilm protein TabA